jgi:hypothetical protein
LHRLLPPSVIAGVSVVCALGPWVFSEATVLRLLAGAAAVTAVLGAVVMRRWDAQAGKQVADLTRARASDEWRFEERVAELETDLEESRELRTRLEQRLRAKRAELAGLRNEHAALLRRYATAETERASALEGRRLLELETVAPSGVPALPPARQPEAPAVEAEEKQDEPDKPDQPEHPAVFSAEGASLYRRAAEALAGFDGEASGMPESEAAGSEAAGSVESEAAEPGSAEPEAAESEAAEPVAAESGSADAESAEHEAVAEVAVVAKGAKGEGAAEGVSEASVAVGDEGRDLESADPAVAVDAGGAADAAEGHARVAAPERPALHATSQVQQPAGHFTVPTAVAVVPAAPARRPMVEGGFDFFGTQKQTSSAALDSVQNEDLADVVGQEALALHKAETEADFKPADAGSRGIGQVIDLTAHDETEQIDIQGLRSAAS